MEAFILVPVKRTVRKLSYLKYLVICAVIVSNACSRPPEKLATDSEAKLVLIDGLDFLLSEEGGSQLAAFDRITFESSVEQAIYHLAPVKSLKEIELFVAMDAAARSGGILEGSGPKSIEVEFDRKKDYEEAIFDSYRIIDLELTRCYQGDHEVDQIWKANVEFVLNKQFKDKYPERLLIKVQRGTNEGTCYWVVDPGAFLVAD